MNISKKIIEFLFTVAIAVCWSSLAVAAYDNRSSKLMSYGEWKSHMRFEIQKKITRLEQKLSDQKESHKKVDSDLNTQLSSEKMRLEASADLSFHEYFLSYLAEQKNLNDKIAELAKSLKPDEIKELISSYAHIIKAKKSESNKQGYATDPLED